MILSARLRVLSIAISLVAIPALSSPLYAKSDPQKGKSGDVIPASAGSQLEAVPVQTVEDMAKSLSLSKEKDGKRYYSDGRLAQERAGSSLAVYTYQDAANSYTVYRSDPKTKTSTVDQFVNGVLRSSLDQDGNYTVYYEDGKVKQRIVHEGLNVFSYDYSYQSTHEIDAEGNWNPITMLTEVNAHLSTASGFVHYSTTTYTRESMMVGSLVTASTVYYAEPVDETVPGRVKPAGFKKVLKAALKSAKQPTETKSVKTRGKNTYTFKAGALTSIQYGKSGPTYYFLDGSLVSVYQDGKQVIRLIAEGFIRL